MTWHLDVHVLYVHTYLQMWFSMVHEADTTKVFDRAKLLTVMYA